MGNGECDIASGTEGRRISVENVGMSEKSVPSPYTAQSNLFSSCKLNNSGGSYFAALMESPADYRKNIAVVCWEFRCW